MQKNWNYCKSFKKSNNFSIITFFCYLLCLYSNDASCWTLLTTINSTPLRLFLFQIDSSSKLTINDFFLTKVQVYIQPWRPIFPNYTLPFRGRSFLWVTGHAFAIRPLLHFATNTRRGELYASAKFKVSSQKPAAVLWGWIAVTSRISRCWIFLGKTYESYSQWEKMCWKLRTYDDVLIE